jgi:hypothetical protein
LASLVLPALVALAGSPADAQLLISPSGDSVVLTDPMVRTAQLGYTPIGSLVTLDPRTGIAVVAVPSAGFRWVRLVGTPVRAGSALVSAAAAIGQRDGSAQSE